MIQCESNTNRMRIQSNPIANPIQSMINPFFFLFGSCSCSVAHASIALGQLLFTPDSMYYCHS